jgi:hypothetical protein
MYRTPITGLLLVLPSNKALLLSAHVSQRYSVYLPIKGESWILTPRGAQQNAEPFNIRFLDLTDF